MLSAGFETRKTSEADSSVPNAAFIGAKFGKTVSMCTPDCFSALLVCCLWTQARKKSKKKNCIHTKVVLAATNSKALQLRMATK